MSADRLITIPPDPTPPSPLNILADATGARVDLLLAAPSEDLHQGLCDLDEDLPRCQLDSEVGL